MSSIPERLARIVKHKFNEVKEHIERMDEEALYELENEQKRLQYRNDARSELNDALNTPRAFDKQTNASSGSAPAAASSGTRLRSPEEIAGSTRPNAQPVSA